MDSYNPPMRNLLDKTILISGGTSGIGKATALACLKAGMRVSICGRNAEKLEEARLELVAGVEPRAPMRVHACAADVTRQGDMRAWVDAAQAAFGRIDAVYCNAGYGLMKPVLAHTDAESRALFETNYYGTLNLIAAAMPKMREAPGGLRHILVCSSAAGKIGLPHYGVYSATKAAQDSIVSAMRAELHDEGFSVSGIYPTGTETEFFKVAGSNGKSNTPSWMEQTPDQVASAILGGLRRPRPEIWPCWKTRVGIVAGTVFPRLAARLMLRFYRGKLG